MVSIDTLKEIAHRPGRKKRDLALAVLAYPDFGPKPIEALRDALETAGVSRKERLALATTLHSAKGLARNTPNGWELTSDGRRRFSAGVDQDEATVDPESPTSVPLRKKPIVFIGHGRSPLWRELKDFVVDRLQCEFEEFNRTPTAGRSNKQRLEEMLDCASFALLLMTAEDEQPDGKIRARQNVVHECGLFQGRLGFERAIILLEDSCDEFSNSHGICQIRFPKGRIKSTFEEIRMTMERERLLKPL